MTCWLLKSEPDVFGLDDLRRKRVAPWDGVRNYQARNFLRAMRRGDRCIFYHSNAEPSGAAGTCTVEREHYPDHTAWDPASPYHDPKDGPEVRRWSMVDVRYESAFARFLPLPELRGIPELADMLLFQRSRLSVQPVEPHHFALIERLGNG
jgi:predicted RNA-binding protein with PUA-like domain